MGDDGGPVFSFDVCVVGTGRVGLPLGLSFIEAGVAAVGHDIDPDLRQTVNDGVMPFNEPGYDELIASRKFRVESDPSVASECSAIVVTVGTPLHNHVETDLSQIDRVLEALAPHLRSGQLLCLRSTVAPGSTEFVRRWIERYTDFVVGEDVFLAFAPERLAEGKAHSEVRTLPQIIGAEDPESRARAQLLFERLTLEILHTDFITAELVKLFNNISRYVHFAVANNFAMIADSFGANVYEVRHLANYNYPRSFIAAPGFTAGTCLRKDFGMVNEWNPYPDMFLAAWKLNEFMPNFLVENLGRRVTLHAKTVAVLGLTFKANTDDLRDSLVPKLWRYVHRQMPGEIRVSDHHVADPVPEPGIGSPRNWPAEEAVRGADVVFVATNHDGYAELLRTVSAEAPDTWIVDIWNVGETDEVFYQARRLQQPPRVRSITQVGSGTAGVVGAQ